MDIPVHTPSFSGKRGPPGEQKSVPIPRSRARKIEKPNGNSEVSNKLSSEQFIRKWRLHHQLELEQLKILNDDSWKYLMTVGLTSEEKMLCIEFAKEPLGVILDNAYNTDHNSSDGSSEKKHFKKKSLKKKEKRNKKKTRS